MRLYEFTQEPPVKAVLRDYIKQGYERVGEPSASAVVLASPSEHEVIKVGKRSDCWLNFAEIAKGSSNPHVPKIKSLDWYGPHYLAAIEFLHEVPETFFKTPTFRKIAAWLHVNGKWANGKDVYLHRFSDDQIKEMADVLQREEPQMVEALKMVVNARGSCNFDVHPENLMKRANGTLVISDPLTHQG
jgi:hypothetical protein